MTNFSEIQQTVEVPRSLGKHSVNSPTPTPTNLPIELLPGSQYWLWSQTRLKKLYFENTSGLFRDCKVRVQMAPSRDALIVDGSKSF